MSLSRLAAGPAAIVVALPWEAGPLAKHLGLRRSRVHGGVAMYRGDGDRLLLQAGMGPQAARAFASLQKPSLILSAGFCGGVGSEVRIGEVVVGSQVIRNTDSFPPDPLLLDTATRALKTVGLPFHVGTILTVDEVVTERVQGRGDLQILAVDMESAYLAERARAQGLPFLTLRVVSDTPAERWAVEARHFVDRDGRLKPVTLATSLLRRPSLIPRMFHLASALRTATRRLAQGINALLKEFGE